MKIEADIKLDFHNVLIRPKRTTLSSRSQVELLRNIKKFPHSPLTWEGVPIIAANITHYSCVICMRLMCASGVRRIKYINDYRNDPLTEYFGKMMGITIEKV